MADQAICRPDTYRPIYPNTQATSRALSGIRTRDPLFSSIEHREWQTVQAPGSAILHSVSVLETDGEVQVDRSCGK